MILDIITVIIFVPCLAYIFLKRYLEQKMITALNSDKKIPLVVLNLSTWLFLPDYDFKRSLHCYLARKILTFKEVENGFISYFGKRKWKSLGNFIERMCMDDETIRNHFFVIGKNYVCKYDHNLSRQNLERLMKFPYYEEMRFSQVVTSVMEEGRWSWARYDSLKVA